MAGDVDTGDLVLILFGKGQNVLVGLKFPYGKRGIDKNAVRRGNLIQHDLQGGNVRERLPAGKDEITVRRDRVHTADTLADFFQRETGHIRVFLLINTEGAMVFAVVGDEYRYSGSARPGFVGMFHVCSAFPYPARRVVRVLGKFQVSMPFIVVCFGRKVK